MPHLGTFQRALATTYGEVGAAVLAARIQKCYDDYFATRPHFEHPALRWHLDYQILPGLALYQILRDNAIRQGIAPEAALKEAGTVIERMDVLARWLPLIRYVPFGVPLFRRVAQLSLALFPAQGWDIQMVEDSSRRFAFTIRRCFYLDVLTAYGAPELTAHYCHLDDVAYAALPPSITWERTTTLARGGQYCDFCWRTEQAQNGAEKIEVSRRASKAARVAKEAYVPLTP